MVNHCHTFNLLVDVTFKVEVSGGEAQPGNLVALDILTQRDVIRKMANIGFETFSMEDYLRRQTALHDVPESERINPRSHVAMQVRCKDILLFSKVLRSY